MQDYLALTVARQKELPPSVYLLPARVCKDILVLSIACGAFDCGSDVLSDVRNYIDVTACAPAVDHPFHLFQLGCRDIDRRQHLAVFIITSDTVLPRDLCAVVYRHLTEKIRHEVAQPQINDTGFGCYLTTKVPVVRGVWWCIT